MRRLHMPAVLLCFCLVTLLGACGPDTQDLQNDPNRDVPREIPDTSPGQMYIAVTVRALDNPAASEGTTGVDIAVVFYHKTDHYYVKFIHGESLECNQITVPAGAELIHFPQVLPQGTPITCHYTGYTASSQKSVATVTVRVPPVPRISTPQPGAQLAHDQPIVVHFDRKTSGVEAISGPDEANRAWQFPQTGQTATLDGHQLTLGPGKICVLYSLPPELPVEGRATGFDSATVDPASESCIPVTWT